MGIGLHGKQIGQAGTYYVRTAHIELHLAVLLFGVAGLFGKLVPASAEIIVFGRTIFAALAIFVGLGMLRVNVRADSARTLVLLVISGMVLALHWWTFFHAIQVSTVAIGLVGFATFPVFVTFLEPVVGGQKLRLVDFFSAFLVLSGLMLVAPAFSLADQGLVGLLWAVFSGFLFAILALLNRYLVKGNKAIVVVLYQQCVAAMCLLPFVVGGGELVDRDALLLLLVLGVICTALPHTLFIRSLVALKAQLASVVAALEPVYGIALAAIFLQEIPQIKTLFGAMLVLGAVLLATFAHAKEPQARADFSGEI